MRSRECEWNAFSFYFTLLFQRLLRRLFSSWKEFLLRSLHIFVRFCKLGSNVKSAPKTSVHSLPEQDPVVRKVNNAISLSSGQRNWARYLQSSRAKSPWNTYARPSPSAMFRCDCKVKWLRQHCKREGETKGSRIFQSVSRFLSEIVGTPWHFWGTLRRQPNTDFKYYWFLLQEQTLFRAISNNVRLKARIE